MHHLYRNPLKKEKPKTNKLFVSLSIFVTLFISILIYTIWDNNRVILVEQDVKINSLPASFDGYKILVLSDLHGKQFGDQQQDLLGLISSVDFDAVYIAGDMQTSDTSGFEPLLEIIAGMPAEVPVYFVAGNWGPYDFDPITGEILDAGKILQSHGVTLLTQPIQIVRGEEHIWFVPGFSYSFNQEWLSLSENELISDLEPLDQFYYSQTMVYQSMLVNTIDAIQNADVMIALTHIPLSKESLDSLYDYPPYDLIIAGHFHGGQIRLPLLGALYVPDNNSSLNGFFPDNHYISGLYAGKAAQQYISRGLGSTGIIPLLMFRLFNTPEVNLITLRAQ
jgi:uncharacterized protein